MNSNIGRLLRNYLHLEQDELKDYVSGWLDDESHQAAESHIQSCPECKEKARSVQREMREFEGDVVAYTSDDLEARQEETPPFQWAEDQTLWINDASYSLKPIDDDSSTALVEGLTCAHLMDKTREDEQSPGTYLASIEFGGKITVFPLSKFASLEVARAACGAASGASSSNEFSHPTKILKYADESLTLIVSTNQSAVFLSLHPPSRQAFTP